MSKAYDHLSWSFLELVMTKIVLNSKLVKLIMHYVKSVSFSLLINGEPHGNIIPSKGICQGYLLSSFLFLFCTKGLISLLKLAEGNKDINGVKIYRQAPSISHILFVEDSMLFYRAYVEENKRVHHLLYVCAKASRQLINNAKL